MKIRLKCNKMLRHVGMQNARVTIARRAWFYYFLASQQKIKRKVSLRSLRLERSGR
jgi:hypothetical protein